MIKFYTYRGTGNGCLEFIAQKLESDFSVTNATASSNSNGTIVSLEVDGWNGKSFSGVVGQVYPLEANWNITIGGEENNEFVFAYLVDYLISVDRGTDDSGIIFVYSNNETLHGGGETLETFDNRFNISNLPSVTNNNDQDFICKAFYNPNKTTASQETNLYISPLAHWNNPGIKFKSGNDIFYTIGTCLYCKSIEESA